MADIWSDDEDYQDALRAYEAADSERRKNKANRVAARKATRVAQQLAKAEKAARKNAK